MGKRGKRIRDQRKLRETWDSLKKEDEREQRRKRGSANVRGKPRVVRGGLPGSQEVNVETWCQSPGLAKLATSSPMRQATNKGDSQ